MVDSTVNWETEQRLLRLEQQAGLKWPPEQEEPEPEEPDEPEEPGGL